MLKDIVGLRNEKIEIKEDVGSKHFPKPTSRKRRVIRIQCDCGVSKEILYENFKKTKSCGCSKQIEVPIGKKYGRLIITKDLGRGYIEGSKTKARHVECVCECGKRIQTQWGNVKYGNVQSCGCLQSETSKETVKIMQEKNFTHGDSVKGSEYFSLYSTWNRMKYRCYNPNYDRYKYYGGKGVRVCDEWLNDYAAFKEWAIANGYRKGLTIDRKDPDGDYEPNNCQWLTLEDNIKKMHSDKRRKTK